MAKSMVLADLGRHLETARITHSSKSSQLTAAPSRFRVNAV
jgi:hypothetical protein